MLFAGELRVSPLTATGLRRKWSGGRPEVIVHDPKNRSIAHAGRNAGRRRPVALGVLYEDLGADLRQRSDRAELPLQGQGSTSGGLVPKGQSWMVEKGRTSSNSGVRYSWRMDDTIHPLVELAPERDAANWAVVQTAMEDFRRAQDASRSATIRQNFVEAEAIAEVVNDLEHICPCQQRSLKIGS